MTGALFGILLNTGPRLFSAKGQYSLRNDTWTIPDSEKSEIQEKYKSQTRLALSQKLRKDFYHREPCVSTIHHSLPIPLGLLPITVLRHNEFKNPTSWHNRNA